MARYAFFLLAAAICFSSLLGVALSHQEEHFNVKGQVYCDTCRCQFMTRVSEFLKGAKVRLECRDREGGSITYSIEGETDADGKYSLPIDGDHEEEICEIVLVKSPREDCNEISKDSFTKTAARISITANNGITSKTRLANPLGFLKKEALPDCPEVLKELGILPVPGIL